MYPEKLMRHLKDEIGEGVLVTHTTSGDAFFWILQYPQLHSSITVITWYEGMDSYASVNIRDDAYKVVKGIMNK